MTEQNAHNLEQIRQTVDEKLSSTLENRLNKSYSIINERLEAVYKGIGEVAQLAGSVADIKKVFTNVKLRGTWGEVQLSSLLEQMLSPAQYRANVHLDPLSGDVVEYAVLLPSGGETVYLPIDSKFPIEEYRRLIDAGDSGDKDAAERAQKNLERALKLQADTIAKKYIRPPLTADFAVMFLPLEGLYAESVKMPGLSEYFARRRIMACGPTNLGALLTTLQIGYKTAAIEKRSGELWELLSAFRHEFRNFVQILEKAQKKLQEAQDTIDSAARKTRTIDKKLKNVSEISDARRRPKDAHHRQKTQERIRNFGRARQSPALRRERGGRPERRGSRLTRRADDGNAPPLFAAGQSFSPSHGNMFYAPPPDFPERSYCFSLRFIL